jgi:hypothetical protein
MRRLFFLVLAIGGCDKGTPASASAPSPSAPPSLAVSVSAPTTATAADASAPNHDILAFVGTLGSHADTRIGVDRHGSALTITMSSANGQRSFRGAMKDATRFAVTEIVKGHAAATLEGELTAAGMTAQSKEPGSNAPLAFSGVPITAFTTETKFSESYVGSLGGKIRIRMKLTRDGDKLTGIYRYARSKEDLRLAGTVSPDGRFELQESDGKSHISGKFKGIFLRPSEAIGDWSSPDGKRSFAVSLERGDGYPETIALAYGGRLAPEEDHRTALNCVAEILVPQAVGLKSKDAENALNPTLRELGGGAASKEAIYCEGATAELPWSTESGYVVGAQRGRYVGIAFSTGGFAGGAHGFGSSICRVIDLETGKAIALSPLLSVDGRSELNKLVTEKIKKEQNLKTLTEGGFFADEAKVSPDTNVCFAKGGGVDVVFNDYEISPHVVGPPEAHFAKEEVRTLFTKNELTDALFK